MAKAESTGSVIDADRVKKYKTSDKVRTTSGRKAVDNDDATARKMRGKSDSELATVAKEAGLGDRWKGWSHLNPGMRRMCLGNALRALSRKPKTKAKRATKKAA